MIPIEFLIYAFLLLIVGTLVTMNSINYIFRTRRVEKYLPFFPFAMGMLGLIPFMISELFLNKMLFDAFFFLGFFLLMLFLYLESKGGRKR